MMDTQAEVNVTGNTTFDGNAASSYGGETTTIKIFSGGPRHKAPACRALLQCE